MSTTEQKEALGNELAAFDEYQGMMPKPADFNAFWQECMAEADAVCLEWSLDSAALPPSPACEFYILSFKGIKGELLKAKFLLPHTAGEHKLPLVLQFHGYPGASRSWFEQASFAGLGAALIALDNPGQGGMSQDVGGYTGTTVSGHLIAGLDGEPRDLYYVRLYQDLRILCRIVVALADQLPFDLERVYVNGASQGGAMGIACAALNPELIAKACILYPFLSDMRLVWGLGADEIAYEGLRYYSRWFDPAAEHLDEWFGKLAYYDTASMASSVSCPVLFGTALEDTVVPPQAQCAVYNRLAAPKERHLYPGFAHEEVQAFDDLIAGYLELDSPSRQTVELVTKDGGKLTLLILMPQSDKPVPAVLHFHDLGRPARGWHYMSRYLALGYAVVQVVHDTTCTEASFKPCLDDALTAYDYICDCNSIDASCIMATGTGFGAALGLALAAERSLSKLAVIAPYPLQVLTSHLDSTAEQSIETPCLLGYGGMDENLDSDRLERLQQKFHHMIYKLYPKHGHERVNAFEDEQLRFLLS